jgi:hypothetical protein
VDGDDRVRVPGRRQRLVVESAGEGNRRYRRAVRARDPADRLAEAVRGAWSDEFEIRRVRLPLYSRMLLVQWGAADPDLASPLEVVITDPRAKADHGAVEHYELTIDIPTAHRVAAAFPELAQAI